MSANSIGEDDKSNNVPVIDPITGKDQEINTHEYRKKKAKERKPIQGRRMTMSKKDKPCKPFNGGCCKHEKHHPSNSKLSSMLHICSFCFAKSGEEKLHPESQCKEKENGKEGSKFTLVNHNVFPKCSCSGGDKGCESNSCTCVRFGQECGAECGCSQTCSNMGLTRGEGKKLRIGESGIQGSGCFADEDIGRGDYVGEYTGELVLRADQGKKNNPSKFLFEIGHEDILLDAERFGSKLAFMNHKTENNGANAVYKLKQVNGVWRVGVWADKDIKEGEELFANYSENYRGHGLITPTKKKSKKGRKKKSKLKKRLQNNNVELDPHPLAENLPSESPGPAVSSSNVTKKSVGERTLSFPSTPSRRVLKLTNVGDSSVIRDLNLPSVSPGPAASSSNVTETNKKSKKGRKKRFKLEKVDTRKNPGLVSNKKSVGAYTSPFPSTPKRIVDGKTSKKVLHPHHLSENLLSVSPGPVASSTPSPNITKKPDHDKTSRMRTPEESTPSCLSTPKCSVDGKPLSVVTILRDRPAIKDLTSQRVLQLDSPNQTQELCLKDLAVNGNANVVLDKTANKSTNAAAKLVIPNPIIDFVGMPNVTIPPEEIAICSPQIHVVSVKRSQSDEATLEKEKSKSNKETKESISNVNQEIVSTPTVNIKYQERAICKKKLCSPVTSMKMSPSVRRSPRIKVKSEKEVSRLRSSDEDNVEIDE